MLIILYQIENIGKEIKIIVKIKWKFSSWRITKIKKKSQEAFHSRLELAEERINKIKNRSIGISQAKEQRKKNEEKWREPQRQMEQNYTHLYVHKGNTKRRVEEERWWKYVL